MVVPGSIISLGATKQSTSNFSFLYAFLSWYFSSKNFPHRPLSCIGDAINTTSLWPPSAFTIYADSCPSQTPMSFCFFGYSISCQESHLRWITYVVALDLEGYEINDYDMSCRVGWFFFTALENLEDNRLRAANGTSHREACLPGST